MSLHKLSPALACAILCATLPVHGQAPGVPIENDDIFIEDAPLVAQAEALKKAGELLSVHQIKVAMKSPSPAALTLPAPSAQRLEPRAIADTARKALIRIGWYYREKDTKEWHVNLAAGYAITVDGAVATCYHCIDPAEAEVKDGFLIAADAAGHILPVTAILACDEEMDAAIVRVRGSPFTPLPLNDQTAPGDAAYVFSDPMGVTGYFTAGIVNRFFWSGETGSADATTLAGARNLRIHASTDWAPGSSGAALLDACGNAIGHVCAIDPLTMDDSSVPEKSRQPDKKSPKAAPPPTSDKTVMLTLHEAIPARGVKLLAESMTAKSVPANAPKE
jgi:S1-C subfamily serine protease